MKKKLLIAFGLVGLCTAVFALGVFAASDIKLFINGTQVNADIQIINGSSYVPLRVVSDSLGAKVSFDSVARTINITSGSSASTPAASTEPTMTSANTNKAGDFSFDNISVSKDDFGWNVTIDVTDNGKDYQGANLTASFYDASGKRVGKASGAILGINKGEMKTTDFVTTDDLTGYKTIKFQVDMSY